MSPLTGIRATREALQRGDLSAREIASATTARISAANPVINAFTAVTAERALREADELDAMRRNGVALPPLAGLAYAAKNLFDVEGIVTLAGARLLASNPPATRDGALIRRMRASGALLAGTLNMDAYAYGFTTENTDFGVTRNPHDLDRVAGGSSGGSGAAIAAGLTAVTLGSDTNGSIRVPASFCGTFGLKPTFGRLSRAGSHPFVASLDHVGPLAASADDLAIVYDALQGHDPDDHGCVDRAIESVASTLDAGITGLRVAILGGHFARCADDVARDAARRAAIALGAKDEVELPHAELARAAAFVITASEGGNAYLEALRERPQEFEPLSRERLTAGALLPGTWYVRAQRFRRWFQLAVRAVFDRFDLLVAPATPCVATAIGAATIDIGGEQLPARASIGMLTQPISFIGLPVATAPLPTTTGMPIGVQLIAAPWQESLCLRAARALEVAGVASTKITRLGQTSMSGAVPAVE